LTPPTNTAAGSLGAGEKVFAAACADCHGVHGEGTEAGGAINDPAFLALMSDQVLRRYIITGRLDLGMPNFAESTGRDKDFTLLTSQQVTDLVALLASWRERIGSE
jgi:mono/diheme cytochrome c family protein